MKWSTVGLLGAAGVMTAAASDAAETVALYVKANGVDIRGDSTVSSLGRANSIECVQIDYAVRGAAELRKTDTIKCVKRIDRSTPLLMKANSLGQTIDATFKFFRPSPAGDGTTQQFYTVVIKGGRVESVRAFVPNTMDAVNSNRPPMEEVAFSFRQITYTFTDGGITHEDTWK